MTKMNLSYQPLTSAVFHILLALVDGEKHGYAIMKDIEAQTEGQFKMGPGTLYGTIKALRAARPAYIIDTAQPPLFEDYTKYHPPVLMNLLREDYTLVGHMYFADIYRLKVRS